MAREGHAAVREAPDWNVARRRRCAAIASRQDTMVIGYGLTTITQPLTNPVLLVVGRFSTQNPSVSEVSNDTGNLNETGNSWRVGVSVAVKLKTGYVEPSK